MKPESESFDDFKSESISIDEKISKSITPNTIIDVLQKATENAVNKKIEKENSAQKATAAGSTAVNSSLFIQNSLQLKKLLRYVTLWLKLVF